MIGSLGAIPRDPKKHLRTTCLESISSSQLSSRQFYWEQHISYGSTSEITRSTEKEDPKITPVQNILWTETKKTEIIIIIMMIDT